MKPGALLRLALAGSRTDALRVTFTAVSAALAVLALLAAATVLAIPTPARSDAVRWDALLSIQYRSPLLAEPGLRPGLAIALVLLTIPVLALAGQAARLGAPGRDRRLAAIRLAGATPRQTLAVAAAETGVASALGSILGLAAYLIGRQLAHRPDANGRLPLPTDVLPAPWALVAIAAGIPALATLTALVLLRRVTVTPFAVVRGGRRTRAPWPWPGFLIVAGTLAIAAIPPVERWYDRAGERTPGWVSVLLLFGGGLLATLGVVLGTAWLAWTAGRVLQRFARRPAALLAARRLVADPWTGSRTFAVLLVCVLFGAGAAGARALLVTSLDAQAEVNRRTAVAFGEPARFTARDPFYERTMDIIDAAVLVALAIAAAGLAMSIAEGIAARRRTYAALIAAGVPRGTLSRAVAWQTFAPAVPAILVALTVGTMLPRGLGTTVNHHAESMTICQADPAQCAEPGASPQLFRVIEVPGFVRTVPVRLDDIALVGGVALAAVLLITCFGLLFLRISTPVDELRTR